MTIRKTHSLFGMIDSTCIVLASKGFLRYPTQGGSGE